MSFSSDVVIVCITVIICIVIAIIRCCLWLEKETRKTSRNRILQHESEPQAVTVTRITETGINQTRIPLRHGEDILDEDGFILIPHPDDSRTEATPMVVPPYPVEPLHPTPQAPPGPGFATTNPPYPTQNPHPLGGAAPYPPVAVPYPPSTTYPPSVPVASTAPYPDYSAQPPSYSEAVAQPPVQPPLPHKEGYSKQSPYNPNY